MTLMAVDYGTKRIGIAVTDRAEKIALPLAVMPVRSIEDGIEKIGTIVREREVRKIIVGLPLAHDGGETDMSRQVRSFAEKLHADVHVPVTLEDERHTTQAAEAPLIEAGMSGRKRRGRVDAGAASVLLQYYLRSHPKSSE